MRECFHSSHISHLVILMKANIHGLSHQIHLMHPLVCVWQSRELLKWVVPARGSSPAIYPARSPHRVIFLGSGSATYATIGVTK